MNPNLRRYPALLAVALMIGGCATTKGPELDASRKESPGDLYVRIAAEYYRLGQLEPALQNAQKALKEDDGNAQAHNVIATIYQRLEQNQLAEEHFRTALRLAPKDSWILTAWGNFLCDQGKGAEADAQYKEALKNPLFRVPWVAQTSAGICARKRGHQKQAAQYLHSALAGNPRYAPALLEMAELDYAQGRYRSAGNYLNRFFQVAGPSPRALLLGVRVARKRGARKQARTYERQLRKRFPNAPETLSL